MAARAIWKGILCLGGEQVPVKLYSAIEDRSIHFRLLHKKDHAPVKQAMVDPKKDTVVPHDDIQRGYYTPDGDLVLFSEGDLDELQPKVSRDIELKCFLPAGVIAYRYYRRPYFLGPDGNEKSYAALVKALQKSGQEGFASWVMRKKEYIGALRVYQSCLMLITLRHIEEVVDLGSVDAPAGKVLDKRELKMAEQLVDMLADSFDPAAYHDDYRKQVLELIDTKASGGKIKAFRPRKQKSIDDLSKALSASIKEEKKHG